MTSAAAAELFEGDPQGRHLRDTGARGSRIGGDEGVARADAVARDAEHARIAERIGRETAAAAAAAASKREAFLDSVVVHARTELELELEREWLDHGHAPLLLSLPARERNAELRSGRDGPAAP